MVFFANEERSRSVAYHHRYVTAPQAPVDVTRVHFSVPEAQRSSANRHRCEHASQPRRGLGFICLDGKGRWKGVFAQYWLFHNCLKAILTTAGGKHPALLRGCHQSELFETVPISCMSSKQVFALKGKVLSRSDSF